jgi:hypothetical protein
VLGQTQSQRRAEVEQICWHWQSDRNGTSRPVSGRRVASTRLDIRCWPTLSCHHHRRLSGASADFRHLMMAPWGASNQELRTLVACCRPALISPASLASLTLPRTAEWLAQRSRRLHVRLSAKMPAPSYTVPSSNAMASLVMIPCYRAVPCLAVPCLLCLLGVAFGHWHRVCLKMPRCASPFRDRIGKHHSRAQAGRVANCFTSPPCTAACFFCKPLAIRPRLANQSIVRRQPSGAAHISVRTWKDGGGQC